jgi:hypothetical protein
MQFRLRTLLIVLAIVPPALAVAWWVVLAFATSKTGQEAVRYFAESPFPWE